MEETGLPINELGYVTSMVYLRSDDIPCLIVSLFARVASESVRLDASLTEYEWLSLEDAKDYDLIEGIYEELEILDEQLKTRQQKLWDREPKKP